MAVDGLHLPAPGLVLHGGVLAHGVLGHVGQLHVVGIVEHDEVGHAQVAGQAANALGHFFFHAAIGDVGDGLMLHPVPEARAQEAFGDGGAQAHHMALAQGAGGVLHAAMHFMFGMSGVGLFHWRKFFRSSML